jgi:hypothetical protein
MAMVLCHLILKIARKILLNIFGDFTTTIFNFYPPVFFTSDNQQRARGKSGQSG